MKLPILIPALCCLALTAKADVRLPSLFSDHMVLQRDTSLPVWGWADAGEQVTVSIDGQEKTAAPDAAGKWMVKIDPLKTGAPRTLLVKGKNSITIRDVLVGEVWLASGQSNMDYALGWKPYDAPAIAAANDNQLRYFDVPHKGTLDPQQNIASQWQAANPQTVEGWSAVGYYFAQILRAKLGVPVAIIKSSYGGTMAESWTSLEALSKDPQWKAAAEKQIADIKKLPEELKAFPVAMKSWIAHGAEDPGDTDLQKDWANPEFDDSTWPEIEIPAVLERIGMKGGGIVWFRKSFPLPPEAVHTSFYFDLGWVNNGAVTVFFNGAELKATTTMDKFAKTQFRFPIDKSLVRPGQSNTIAVRLHALTQDTNWGAPFSRMSLPLADPKAVDNQWKYQIAQRFPPVTHADIVAIPETPMAEMRNTSGTLFNAMINPLIPYAFRGVIWYQGENNTNPPDKAFPYRRLLPMLIEDWRARWGEGNFPFYIVQLANYGAKVSAPGGASWAVLRESQSVVARQVPNTGVAVIIDIGEGDNIHPRNKKDVGYRLALLALNRTYGQSMEDSGPVYESMKLEGGAIRLAFSHVGGGLIAKGGPLSYFAIAGADKKFVWADAKIDGETVVVSSPSVASPVAVRYAWGENPEGCNLYNKEGLPASPFRTDMP